MTTRCAYVVRARDHACIRGSAAMRAQPTRCRPLFSLSPTRSAVSLGGSLREKAHAGARRPDSSVNMERLRRTASHVVASSRAAATSSRVGDVRWVCTTDGQHRVVEGAKSDVATAVRAGDDLRRFSTYHLDGVSLPARSGTASWPADLLGIVSAAAAGTAATVVDGDDGDARRLVSWRRR